MTLFSQHYQLRQLIRKVGVAYGRAFSCYSSGTLPREHGSVAADADAISIPAS